MKDVILQMKRIRKVKYILNECRHFNPGLNSCDFYYDQPYTKKRLCELYNIELLKENDKILRCQQCLEEHKKK